jgi:Domain of unknown function (DUF222)
VVGGSLDELGPEGLAFGLGFGKPADLLKSKLRITTREAKQRMKVGAAIRPRHALDGSPLPDQYPTLARLVDDGTVGLAYAEILVAGLEAVAPRAKIDDLEAAERDLAAEAAKIAPDSLSVEVAVWREVLDPDGAEPREDAQREARSLRMGRARPDGMTPISMLAHPEAAGFIRATLDAYGLKLKFTCQEGSRARTAAARGPAVTRPRHGPTSSTSRNGSPTRATPIRATGCCSANTITTSCIA